jgi:hypothetical protein
MSVLKTFFSMHRSMIAPIVVMAIGLVFMISFGRQTFGLPLLGDHCMKTSKSVEVAYDLVRYGDFLHEYNDWKALPNNPQGKQGSILKYESPFSAIALGIVYLVVDGTNFDTRIAAARIFILFHLVIAYLIIAVFIFRRDLLSLVAFTFLFVGAAFTVSYSTKPFAETSALMYQSLFIAASVHLLGSKKSAKVKSILLAAFTAMLCLGGKMNYFLVAFPVIVGYAFIDRNLLTAKHKLHYFTLFVVAAVFGFLVLLLFSDINFYNAFVYMIRGNKPILNNSLWQTFIEGFDGLKDILKRTREDFGTLLYDWGRYGFFYLCVKFLYLVAATRKRDLSPNEKFSAVLFLFVLGHILNYAVLRNLFIPHRYYVVPWFILFCLSITVLVGDIRTLLLHDFPLKNYFVSIASRKFPRSFTVLFSPITFLNTYTAIVSPFVLLGMVAIVTGYFSSVLFDPQFRSTAVLTFKTFGSSALAIDIVDTVESIAFSLKIIAIGFGAAAVVFVSIMIIAGKTVPIQRLLAGLSVQIRRLKVVPLYIAFLGLLLIPSGIMVFHNAKNFFEYASSHIEYIETSRQLETLRHDTKSGDLVLSWKPCIAFYADKRSILEPKMENLQFYRDNDIHSVMGPVKPFDKYYKRIEKYPPPMSYWEPKSAKKSHR